MREELKRNILQDFSGGLNLSADSSKKEEFVFTEYKNLVATADGNLGNATRRGSFRSKSAISGATFTAIYNISEHSDGRLLLATDKGYYLYNVGTGALTTVSSSYVPTSEVGIVPYQDRYYLTPSYNSGLARQHNNLVIRNNFSMREIGTPPCPQTFTLTNMNKSGGKLTAVSEYYYMITYIYENGQESWVIPQIAPSTPDRMTSASDYIENVHLDLYWRHNTLGAGNNAIKISNIPIGSTGVVARRIYRTKGESGQLYYHSTIWDNTTTEFIDDLLDECLIEPCMAEFIFKPLIMNKMCEHNGYLFGADCTENQFEEIATADINGVSITDATTSGAGSTPTKSSAGRTVSYKYKFANIFFGHNTDTSVRDSVGSQTPILLNGMLGATNTTTKDYGTTETSDYEIRLSNIPNTNVWSGHTAVFRNVCQMVAYVDYDGGETITLEFADVDADKIFQLGEQINVEGLSSLGIPDGTYEIDGFTAGTTHEALTFIFEVGGASFNDTDIGVVTGNKFYFAGITPIISSQDGQKFNDRLSDERLVEGNGILIGNNIELTEGNKSYPSLVVWSRAGSPDVFSPDNMTQISENDGDKITAICSTYDGVLIFKERSIGKLYTTSDEMNWEQRRIYEGIGCSDTLYSRRTFQRLPNGLYSWVMDSRYFLWQEGQEPQEISYDIRTFIASFNYVYLRTFYDPYRKWIIVSYLIGSNVYDMLIYDMNMGAWYYFDISRNGTYRGFGCLLASRKDNPKEILLGSLNSGLLFEYLETDTQDSLKDVSTGTVGNVEIISTIRSKRFDMFKQDIARVMAKVVCSTAPTTTLKLYSDGSAGSNISVTYRSVTMNTKTFNTPVNVADCREIEIELSLISTKIFNLKALAYDFKEKGEEAGF